jgi:hypothetical protein
VGQEHAIFNDFDGAASHWTLRDFLRITDRYDALAPVKGTFTKWRPRFVHITTNLHPWLWYDYTKRIKQWDGVVRRFDVVRYYLAGSTSVLRPGTNNWRMFWEWRPGGAFVGRLGKENTINYTDDCCNPPIPLLEDASDDQ